MNVFRERSRPRAPMGHKTRGICAAGLLAMALVASGCLDGVEEAPPEAGELTQTQLGGMPLPGGPVGPGGPGGAPAQPLACMMLSVPASSPAPPGDCYPLNCGAHCGNWEALCNQVEYAGMSVVPFSEFLTVIIGLSGMLPDIACGLAWNRAQMACASGNTDECISRRIVATCGCLMHEQTRGYADQAAIGCQDCACWKRNGPYPYGEDTSHFDAALRCYKQRTSARPGRGGGFGDPHLQSLDGAWIEHQFAGEFVALRKRVAETGPDLEVRFREEPTGGSFSGDVSSVTAVAVRYGAVVVAVYSDAVTEVRVDGNVVSLEDGHHDTGGAGDYAVITREGDVYKILLPNGDLVAVDDGSGLWLNVAVELTADLEGKTEGLLGNWNGLNDEAGLGVNDFRVTSAASSLLLRSTDDWEALDDTTFPANPFDPNQAPPEDVAAAEAACAAAGVAEGPILQGCIHDVAATGDETAATAAAAAGALLAVEAVVAPPLPIE
jgi:hypothetical protein